ncbi:MAG: hypothetical protein Q9160_001121 [Pyrenula sp. 1 TL-2023]
MPVADPSSAETQETLKRVQRLSTQKHAAVDIDKLVEWHKRKSLHKLGERTNGESEADWGGLGVTDSPDSSEKQDRGVFRQQNVHADKKNNTEKLCKPKVAVHYKGVVDLPHTNVHYKREERPSRDFVESFPPWFLHREYGYECHSEVLQKGEKNEKNEKNECRENNSSAVAWAEGGVLGAVDKAVTPTPPTPVPKHDIPDVSIPTPFQNTASVDFHPFGEALYGVKQTILAPQAPRDPSNVIRPANAPRRRGHPPQSDTKAPNEPAQKYPEVIVSGFIVANETDIRDKVDGDNSHAISNKFSSSGLPVSAAHPEIPPKDSNHAHLAHAPKACKGPGPSSNIGQSTGYSVRDELASPANWSGITPGIYQSRGKRLIVPVDCEVGITPHCVTRPPQPRAGQKVNTIREALFPKHSGQTSLSSNFNPTFTTVVNGIGAVLHSPSTPPSTASLSTKGGPIMYISTDTNCCSPRQRHLHKTYAQPPTSPPPRGPLPAVPESAKSVSGRLVSNASSLTPNPHLDLKDTGGLPRSSKLISTGWPLPSPNPMAPSTTHFDDSSTSLSDIRDASLPNVKSRPFSVRAQTTTSSVSQLKQYSNKSSGTSLTSSTTLQRAVSMSSLDSSISNRTKRWAGRPRKDLKMRHLNSARARAENERLEWNGNEKSMGNNVQLEESEDDKSLAEASESTRSSLQTEKDPSYRRSTAVPIQMALQGHGRNNSPHTLRNGGDPTSSRQVKRRTSFFGSTGNKELILLSKISTPPRSLSAQETRTDHFRSDSIQSTEIHQPQSRENSLLRQSLVAEQADSQKNEMSTTPTLHTIPMSSDQTISKEQTITTVRDKSDVSTSSHDHRSHNVATPVHSSPSTYSTPSTFPSISSSPSPHSSRLSILEARCADLETQLLRHRAWTYAMLFPAQVLQAANPADLAVAQNTVIPQGLGVWTPPPSAALEGQNSGDLRPAPLGRGGGRAVTGAGNLYTPRPSDETNRSGGMEASPIYTASEDEGVKGRSPSPTARRHRLRNAHSSWSLFGASLTGDEKKRRSSGSSGEQHDNSSRRTSSRTSVSQTRVVNKKGSLERMLDRFPKYERAGIAEWV